MSIFNRKPGNRHSRLTTHGGKLFEPETPSIPVATVSRMHTHRRSDRILRFILLKNDEAEGLFLHPSQWGLEGEKDGEESASRISIIALSPVFQPSPSFM
jgi:hypothetical protein